MKLKLKTHLRLAAENWRGKYDSVKPFYEGLAEVQLNGQWGFINTEGEEVAPPKYDSVGNFSKGLAVVKLNGQWGFIDKTGKEVVPVKYDSVDKFYGKNGGLAGVYLNGQRGFVDKTGKEVVPPGKYTKVFNFEEGLAQVQLNGQWGLVDITGKELLPCVYNENKIPVTTLEKAIKLSNQIKKKYEQDSEGLELSVPEFDWKSWYEQLEGQ